MNLKDVEAIYPLSPLQEAMLLDSSRNPRTQDEVGQRIWELQGALEITALENAWQLVVNHQAILRSFFAWKRVEKPLQIAHKKLTVPVEKQNLSDSSVPDQQQLDAFLKADRERSFDPAIAPLVRLTLCRLSEDTHRLVLSYHPLVLDRQSLDLIGKELFTGYEAFCQNQEPQLPSSPSFRNYIVWLKDRDQSASETYWRQELSGIIAPTPLLDRLPTTQDGQKGAYNEQFLQLSATETSGLRSLAQEHGFGLHTLVQGAWAVLLSRYCDDEEVVFGSSLCGRPEDLQGSAQMVGAFRNTLPIRVRLSPDRPVLAWLKTLEAQHQALQQYADDSQTFVHATSDMPDDLPLFESAVVIAKDLAETLVPDSNGELTIRSVQTFEPTNLPLTLEAQFDSELRLRIIYDSKRFDQATISRILDHLQTLLQGIGAQPERLLSTLPILPESALRQMLIEWNDTRTDNQQDLCIHQLIEAQVERTPETLAVIYEDERLTYRQLNQKANQLAHYLMKLGVAPKVLVGLCVERSIEMIVGILGVLKAGGAYVPLDPSYPFERLCSMLDDAQPPVLLTQERLIEDLPPYHGRVVFLDDDWDEVAKESEENPDSDSNAEELAYVIYTSGSTGKPKGVMVPHRGVCNSEDYYARIINLPPGSRMLQLTSIGFDMSVFDIVPALISGLTLCLANQEPPLGEDLLKVLEQQEIEVISFPPSMLATLPCVELPKLKFIGVAGEAIPADLMARWAPGRRFYNAFGPAEGSIWVCGTFLESGQAPIIGRPIDNIRLYLLDSQWRPVPVGVPGELCIGGIGVTWGYLRQPDVTADKYIPDPFSDSPGARLYRTGDLARYLPDGNLDFLGRIDHQVKIRGFRIELGEVESVLGRHPDVREVVVVAREDAPGDKRLVAYIVPHPEQSPTVSELHSYMRKKLPDNMVPSTYLLLESLPLSPNGKVDRRALPTPELNRPELEEAFVAPRNHVEVTLAEIWADILRLEQVGIHDNFFELGGHSLLATQVVSRVRDVLQVELSLPGFFEAPTIVKLAKIIEQSKGDTASLSQPNILAASREGHRVKRSALEAGD